VTEFEEIYDNYFKDVYLYIYGLSGDKYIAEDITSDTFMKAIKNINSFKGNSDIRVWLCQIAKNSYFSYLRRNKRLVNIDQYPNKEGNIDIEEIICSSEDSMKIHEILHDLNEPYKEVFTLRVFGELSFKQIASLFGKNENWACVTYHRAKNKIKDRMEGYK
jgi:RNA polymerase sigma factor, sigma-70 family